MDDAEVRTKMSLDSVELRAGTAQAKEVLKNFAEESESKFHKLHHSIRMVRQALHGFGIIGAITAGMELYEKLKDFWIPFITGADRAEEKQKAWTKSLHESREALKQLEAERNQASKIRGEIAMDDATPEEKVNILKRQLDELNEKRAKFSKEHGEDAYAWHKVGDAVIANTETQAKFAAQRQKYDNDILLKQREIGKAEKDANEATLKAAEKEATESRKAFDEKEKHLQRIADLQDKMNRAVEKENDHLADTIAKIKEAAGNKFIPSDKQVLDDGWFDRKGRFHGSEASQMQQDINQEKKDFIESRLRGDYAGDKVGALNEVKHIEHMESQLREYLGGSAKTTEQKIAEATVASAKSLKEITAEFKK